MKTIKCFNQSIKFGDTITLTASGGVDYLWNTGATTASIDVSPDSSAIYYITVTDANGCINFDDVTILVGSSTMPYPEAYWHKNDSIISTISGVTKVGIGTNTPTERLDVAGNVVVSDMLKVGAGLRIDSLAGEGYKFDSLENNSYKMLFADKDGFITTTGTAWKCDPNHPFQYPWVLGGNWVSGPGKPDNIGTCNYYPFKMKTNNVERMRITETGNVGIGNTNAKDLLQVGKRHTISLGELAVDASPNGVLNWSSCYVGFNAVHNTSNDLWEFVTDAGGSNNSGGVIMSEIGRGMVFIPVFSDLSKPNLTNQELFSKRVMELSPINPSYPNEGGIMSINGKIISKKVEVLMTGWWDKVFEQEYHLMPLDSLEAYLFTYKHLPDIPTSDEVIINGLDVGEFNALLLKKVEELYLYIIEQNKTINELKININNLHKCEFD